MLQCIRYRKVLLAAAVIAAVLLVSSGASALPSLGAAKLVVDPIGASAEQTASHADTVETAARLFQLNADEASQIYQWLDRQGIGLSLESKGHDGLTRSQLAALAVKLLPIDDSLLKQIEPYNTFDDVTPDHPVFAEIEMLHRLGLLPSYLQERLFPDEPVSQQELMNVLEAAAELEVLSGTIKDIDEDKQTFIIETAAGTMRILPVKHTTLLLVNGSRASFADFILHSRVMAVTDTRNQARLISTHPQEQGGILQSLGSLFEGYQTVLSPQQITAVLQGDWDSVQGALRHDLYKQLVELGLTPWEADAVLSQDWDALQSLGQDRVAHYAAYQLGLAPELIYSAFSQDWPELLEYAQLELAQRLLSGQLF